MGAMQGHACLKAGGGEWVGFNQGNRAPMAYTSSSKVGSPRIDSTLDSVLGRKFVCFDQSIFDLELIKETFPVTSLFKTLNPSLPCIISHLIRGDPPDRLS